MTKIIASLIATLFATAAFAQAPAPAANATTASSAPVAAKVVATDTKAAVKTEAKETKATPAAEEGSKPATKQAKVKKHHKATKVAKADTAAKDAAKVGEPAAPVVK